MSPAVGSIGSLARILGLPSQELIEIAENAPRYYAPYFRQSSGSERLIDNPVDPLKTVQKRIYRRLLANHQFPDWVQGGVKHRSTLTNAGQHCGKRVVVRIDIKSCFPSITNSMVFRAYWKRLSMAPPVASLLTKLTTLRGRVPTGAPTSTAIANLVLLDVDGPIAALAAASGCSLTRWIDDIVISGDAPTQLLSLVFSCLRRNGFRVNRKKLTISPRNRPQQVTGYLVNGDHPSVSRQRRDRVKAAVLDSRVLVGNRTIRRRIEGRIAFIGTSNPHAAKALRVMLEARLAGETPELSRK